jgi:UDP-2,3-diacylglucosamine hydrolase
MKNYYFISDAHLGCRAFQHHRTQERRLVRFLDTIKDKAEAVFMLGDMFDFWFEYDDVVPRGFTRFLGKVSELTDRGVEVHFFQGNHDMWCTDYLVKECGVILHREASTMELCGKVFYLAHGYGLDPREKDWKTQLMYNCFESHTLRRLAAMIHPHWFINFGLNWAKHNREKHINFDGPPTYKGEDKEGLVLYAKEYLKSHPDINYFMFGHRHIDLDIFLQRDCRLMILGEWYSKFTYAVFDGENMFMDNYIEGETEL